MNEYNIFLFESAKKGSDGKFTSVSQDLIISGINQDLKTDNFIGKLIKEGETYKVIFRDNQSLGYLEKISRTLKNNNFSISIDPEVAPDFITQEPITVTQSVEIEQPEEIPKKQPPKLFRHVLDKAFRCPHLGDPNNKYNELPGVINPDKLRDFTEKDAFNCLLSQEGLSCPYTPMCYEQNLLASVAQVVNQVKDNYDVFVFDFENHDREMSLLVSKTGEMAVAPKKKP